MYVVNIYLALIFVLCLHPLSLSFNLFSVKFVAARFTYDLTCQIAMCVYCLFVCFFSFHSYLYQPTTTYNFTFNQPDYINVMEGKKCTRARTKKHIGMETILVDVLIVYYMFTSNYLYIVKLMPIVMQLQNYTFFQWFVVFFFRNHRTTNGRRRIASVVQLTFEIIFVLHGACITFIRLFLFPFRSQIVAKKEKEKKIVK